MSPYVLALVQPPRQAAHPHQPCTTNASEHSRADWACAQPVRTAPLTPVQRRIYDYVRDYQRLWGVSPLYREIAEECGLKSNSAVQYQITRLVKLGWARKPPRLVRAILLNDEPDNPD